MIKAPLTPKGFRDIGPELAKKRQEVIGKIVNVLEEAGFVPIETPTIEFAETLKGKYGEEERLIYQFTDRGGRELALRYDLTVPLARYVATYNPRLPFRRYQIGQVFRGENPQKGRWREFTQVDFDIVGSSDLEEDAKIIAGALACCKKLGIKGAQMRINDRKIFEGLSPEIVRTLDKLDKIGEEEVIVELTKKLGATSKANTTLTSMRNKKPTNDLGKIFQLIKRLGVSKNEYIFDPLLARGLDYYTGAIFELKIPAFGNLSIGAGGRYDNLIGTFSKKDIPAVGFSVGLDRLVEAVGY